MTAISKVFPTLLKLHKVNAPKDTNKRDERKLKAKKILLSFLRGIKMKLEINQLHNNTEIQNCSCCDIKVNLYSASLEFSVNVDMNILTQSESAAQAIAIKVVKSLNFDTEINEDISHQFNITNFSFE